MEKVSGDLRAQINRFSRSEYITDTTQSARDGRRTTNNKSRMCYKTKDNVQHVNSR